MIQGSNLIPSPCASFSSRGNARNASTTAAACAVPGRYDLNPPALLRAAGLAAVAGIAEATAGGGSGGSGAVASAASSSGSCNNNGGGGGGGGGGGDLQSGVGAVVQAPASVPAALVVAAAAPASRGGGDSSGSDGDLRRRLSWLFDGRSPPWMAVVRFFCRESASTAAIRSNSITVAGFGFCDAETIARL